MFRRLTFIAMLTAVSALSGCNCGGPRQSPPGGEPEDGGAPVDAGAPGDAGASEDAGSGDGGLDGGGPLGRLELVAVSADGDIIIVEDDGGARVLASRRDAGVFSWFMQPRWQPHGDQVAFGDGDRAWLALADGGLRRLESTVTGTSDYQGNTRRVEWSPNGKRLAISGLELSTDNESVFLLPDDGGVEPMLIGVARDWSWAHDSSGLYFTAYVSSEGTWRTWFRDVDGGAAVRLVDGQFLDVSSTGAVAYQDEYPLLDGGYFYAQYFLASDGGAGGLVVPENTILVNAGDTAATFNPDGARLAMSGTFLINLAPVNRAVVASGGVVVRSLYDPQALTEAWPRCVRWEPGGQLSYQTQDAGVPVLFLEASDGGAEAFATPRLAMPYGYTCHDWRRVP